MRRVLLVFLIYLFFLLESLFPKFFPKMSIILFIVNAFSLPLFFSTLLGFFLGFLFDLNNIPIFGLNTLLFAAFGFLIPYFRHYLLPTTYNYFFSLLLIIILFSLINKSFFLVSFLFTLVTFFLLKDKVKYEKKI
uniref:Rod shape-determining protein MreD n=1 Tax=candidate division WOR-3 bacterium TaxID=2052148 RepID=A0A7V3ZW53_UNCW3